MKQKFLTLALLGIGLAQNFTSIYAVEIASNQKIMTLPANSRLDEQSAKKNIMREAFFKTQINKLERKIHKKIKSLHSRLNKYKSQLSKTNDGKKAQIILSKIDKVEQSISALHAGLESN